MLTLTDICNLQIQPITDKTLLPNYTKASKTAKKYAEIGVDIVSQLLDATNEELETMTRLGTKNRVPMVTRLRSGGFGGIIPSVSMVHGSDILNKNIVIPNIDVFKNTDLEDNYVVGIFVTGMKWGDTLEISPLAKVVGWLNTMDIAEHATDRVPGKFHTVLPKTRFVPCEVSRPISEFGKEFDL